MRSPLTTSIAAVALLAGSAGPAVASPPVPRPAVPAARVDAEAHAATVRALGRRHLSAGDPAAVSRR